MTPKKIADITQIALQYIEVCKEISNKEQEKKALSASLLLLIPADEEIAGVKHIKESKGQPSWKSIAERIGRELVPASRKQLIEPIIEACTGKPREYIKRVGET